MIETINFNSLALYSLGGILLLTGLGRVKQRTELSLAKYKSLAGHPRNARRLASLLPSYQYDEAHVFGVDGAPDDIVKRRKTAFETLLAQFQTRYPRSLQETAGVVNGLSDLQFTSAYRIPYQFRYFAGNGLKIASFVQATSGVTVTDLDGNQFYDLTGSYGVNLFGNDFYKDCIEQGAQMVRQLGLFPPSLRQYLPDADSAEIASCSKPVGYRKLSRLWRGWQLVPEDLPLSIVH